MIENCDAVDLVVRLATPETVVYCDPPYVASTRVGRYDSAVVGDYRHEYTNTDHKRLAEVLHSTPATVFLSGYESPLYDSLYGDWWTSKHAVTSYSANARSAGRGGRVEVLWSNKPPMSLFSEVGS